MTNALHRTLALLATVACVLADEPVRSQSDSSSGSDDRPEVVNPYFYVGHPEASPVREFAVFGPNPHDYPDFIYDPPDDAYRLVEFYAHWCPHCQRFRKHYILIAKKIEQLALKYGIKIRIYGVSCEPHKKLCRHQGVTGYPRVKLFPPRSDQGQLINYYELHPFHILRMTGVNLDDEMERQISDELDEDSRKQQEEDGVTMADPNRHFLPRTKSDIFNDAYLSFDYAMRHGIFTAPGPLTNRTREVFEEWITQVQSSIPPTWGLQNMVSDIKDDFDYAVQSERNLLSIVDRHPPKKKTWSKSCSRGEPYAGYTCGLWELFHIMSIGMVVFNQNIIGDDDWSFFRPEEFGDNLRNFVELFFGCEVCRMHFVSNYDSCGADRCNRLVEEVGDVDDWTEFPLWLFETHNAVNVRLLKEKAEREHRTATHDEEIAVLWPSRSDCGACWHSDGRWDPDMVYAHLRVTYWPEDEYTAQFKAALEEAAVARAEQERVKPGLTTRAASLYAGAFTVVVALTWWYSKRLHRQKTGLHKKIDT